MLADPEKKAAFAYGVIPPDAPPNRQFARRWTFYIAADGAIVHIDKQVRASSHGSDVAARLRELGIS